MIPQSNDPAILELKRIVEEELTNKCSFMYANMHEANFGLDKLEKEEEFPVFVLLANDKSTNKVTDTGLIIRTIEVYGLMLNSVDDPTIDYSSEDIDPYVNQMRLLCDNLIHRLNHSSITELTQTIEEYEFSKIYEKFDRHLFGGGLSFKWSVNTQSTGCYPILDTSISEPE
jgi:hypothetical protein